MPKVLPCLRISLLLPTRYDPEDPYTPNQEIELEKFVAIQLMLTGRYGGLTILQPFQPPFVEGWWPSNGALPPPEQNVLVDIVTRALVSGVEQETEKEWIRTELYPRLRDDFRQREIFLLIQQVQRIFEIEGEDIGLT